MPNQNNYKTNTNVVSSEYIKYSVSRIVSSPSNALIDTEIPALVPDDFILEISLYSLADESLIFFGEYASNNEAFEVRNLIYADGSVRRMLFINFQKFGQDEELPTELINTPGTYEIVINFFVPQIGTYLTSSLQVTEIAPSRTEIQLQLKPQHRTPENVQKLKDFASPSINSVWVLDALKYICNQTQSLNPNIPTSTASLSFNIVQAYLPPSESIKLNNPNVSGDYTESIKRITQEILNKTYMFASQSIKEVVKQDTRFTDTMLVNIVSSSLQQALAAQGPASFESNFIII